MVLAPHILVGVVLAQWLPLNGWLAFGVLLSHYILDTLPHWEYVENIEGLKKRFWVVLLDLSVGLSLAIGLAGLSWPVLWAIFFSLLPDLPILLMAFYKDNQFLKSYFSLNDFLHLCHPTSVLLGVTTQLLVIASAVIILFITR